MTDDFPPTLPEAFVETEAIAWHEAQSSRSARELARRILTAVSQLQLFPESGSPYLRGTRRIVLVPLPYELVYLIDDGTLKIIAFAHTSRAEGY